MLSQTRKRSRAGAALGSRTSELGSGTPWAEADRGRELEQMREEETRSGFKVRSSVCLMANNSWTNEEMNQHSTYSGNSRIPLKKPEMKNNTGIAMVWTPEEQTILDNALARYPLDSCVSSCLRYAKISLELPQKTTKDVAMRCRWIKELGRVKVEDSISAPHDVQQVGRECSGQDEEYGTIAGVLER
ncbi:unnamed protein product [Brassica oleracea]